MDYIQAKIVINNQTKDLSHALYQISFSSNFSFTPRTIMHSIFTFVTTAREKSKRKEKYTPTGAADPASGPHFVVCL